jgi:cell division protein FtsB
MRESVRRLGFRGILAFLWTATAYYLVFGGMFSVFDVRAMEESREQAITRIDRLVARTDSLVHRGDSLEAVPAAIERVAREEFGLVRDGEILVRFVPPRVAGGPELDE